MCLYEQIDMVQQINMKGIGFSRLLFPTYFFDMVDRIINNLEEEIIIKKVITKNKDYILLIKSIFYHIIYEKGFNIPTIEWIMKS